MIKIRLARFGKKNSPFYRIVVVKSRQKREGAALEVVGWWDPKSNKLKVNKENIEAWKAKGAKETEAVRKLLT